MKLTHTQRYLLGHGLWTAYKAACYTIVSPFVYLLLMGVCVTDAVRAR